QDIGTTKWTIVSLCRQAKSAIADDPVAQRQEILGVLEKLCTHASRLGKYAADVIQSVRETHRAPVIQAQDLGPLLTWVTEVLASGDAAPAPLSWHAEPRGAPLRPVLADRSFLRL